MHGRGFLEFECEFKQIRRTLGIAAACHDSSDLIEHGFGQRRHRTQHAAMRLPATLEHDPHAKPTTLGANVIEHVTGANRDGNKVMRDKKPRIINQADVQSSLLKPVAPEFPGNVGHDAATITLAAHLAAAVRHLGQCLERPFDVAVRWHARFANRANHPAGIMSNWFV